jgi:hypothetical protein
VAFEVGQPFQADKTRETVRLESLTYMKLGQCHLAAKNSLDRSNTRLFHWSVVMISLKGGACNSPERTSDQATEKKPGDRVKLPLTVPRGTVVK